MQFLDDCRDPVMDCKSRNNCTHIVLSCSALLEHQHKQGLRKRGWILKHGRLLVPPTTLQEYHKTASRNVPLHEESCGGWTDPVGSVDRPTTTLGSTKFCHRAIRGKQIQSTGWYASETPAKLPFTQPGSIPLLYFLFTIQTFGPIPQLTIFTLFQTVFLDGYVCNTPHQRRVNTPEYPRAARKSNPDSSSWILGKRDYRSQ